MGSYTWAPGGSAWLWHCSAMALQLCGQRASVRKISVSVLLCLSNKTRNKTRRDLICYLLHGVYILKYFSYRCAHTYTHIQHTHITI